MTLDEEMKKAGMMPLSDILNKNSLGNYSAHAGVTDLEAFEKWLLMKHEEMTRAFIRLELDKNQDHKMYEWYLSHKAVLGEVVANFRQATNHQG